MDNIEGYYTGRSSVPSGSRMSSPSSFGRSYSRSYHGGSPRDSSYRRTTSPPSYIKHKDYRPKSPPSYKTHKDYRQTSTTYTMGRTGGAPFWGWVFAPYLLYPLIEYAPINAPTTIDLGNDKKVESKVESKKVEKFIEIKNIYPEYKF